MFSIKPKGEAVSHVAAIQTDTKESAEITLKIKIEELSSSIGDSFRSAKILVPANMLEQLKTNNPPVIDAHELLLEQGYQFIGYHGTSESNMEKIVINQFNPKYIGTSTGTERGYGFYVSWDRRLAEDYITENGEGKILRIYAKNLPVLRLGIHYKWGLIRTPGDPNGDLDIERTSRGTVDLELVLNPSIYKNLAAIPSAGLEQDKILEKKRYQWPAYSIDEELLKVLGTEQPYWFPPPPLKRQRSDVSGCTPLQKWVSFGNLHLTREQRYEKGLKYYHGIGCPRNMKKAKDWFLTIAEEHPGAQSKLADIYANGRDVTVDMQKAITFYEKADAGGDVVATFSLGYCYESGKGVARNIAKAKELYNSAQCRGYEGWSGYHKEFMNRNFSQNPESRRPHQLSPEEQYKKGLLYYHGDVVEKDMVQAEFFFRLAADGGHANANEKLGDIYENGRGVPTNVKMAIERYKFAENLGDVQAMFALGQCYEKGKGLTQDFEQALEYYTKAYNKGYEGYPGYYNNFIKNHPELISYLETRMSHRRFILGMQNT